MKKMLLVWMVFVFTNAIANELPSPVFENASEELTESGYAKLSWRWAFPEGNKNGCEFELQQSESEDFGEVKAIYKGPDYATFLSGLKNGQYYHRVRTISETEQAKSDWSAPVLIRVKHHSLRLAFTLFGVGAIVFFATVLLVVQGNRNAARNQ
jgi:hypothetical protein